MNRKKGLHRDVPLAEYHALDAYGSSDLRAMRAGPPALVPWRKKNPSLQTDATRLGTAAHCAIIEPAAFEARFAHKPDGMKFSTKDGIAWRDDPARAGMEILTHDEWEQVGAIVHAFNCKPTALESLQRATGREVTAIWQDPDTGLWLKARPDWFDGEFVTDLKVTRWASSGAAAFRSWAEGWMHQVVHYRAGLAECGVHVKGCRLVLVHPEPPQVSRVVCVQLKEDAAGLLHLENERTVQAMAACVASGVWPGEVDEWQKIDLPAVASASIGVDWGDESVEPLTAARRR